METSNTIELERSNYRLFYFYYYYYYYYYYYVISFLINNIHWASCRAYKGLSNIHYTWLNTCAYEAQAKTHTLTAFPWPVVRWNNKEIMIITIIIIKLMLPFELNILLIILSFALNNGITALLNCHDYYYCGSSSSNNSINTVGKKIIAVIKVIPSSSSSLSSSGTPNDLWLRKSAGEWESERVRMCVCVYVCQCVKWVSECTSKNYFMSMYVHVYVCMHCIWNNYWYLKNDGQ